jgi:hypothetical protein
MRKLAAEESPGLSKKQLQTIKEEIKSIKPQTEEEKKITELVGKHQTRGQILRGTLIGTTAGIGVGALGNLIEGGGKKIMTPRGALRSAVMGVTFGAAMPAIRRIADIEVAKRGQF